MTNEEYVADIKEVAVAIAALEMTDSARGKGLDLLRKEYERLQLKIELIDAIEEIGKRITKIERSLNHNEIGS